MRALDRIATAIVLFLGVGHVAATPRFASGFTEGAAWFAGSGLTLVFVAFLNLSRLASSEADRRLCLIANAATLVWIVFVATMVPVLQAFLAAAAVLILTVVTLIQRRKAAEAVR